MTKKQRVMREYYKRNHEVMDARTRRYSIAHKQALRAFIKEVKNAPCMDCGRVYPACVMDFDHRKGEVKDKCVGEAANRGWSLDRLKREIAKCDIVCANCHRIRTHLIRKK